MKSKEPETASTAANEAKAAKAITNIQKRVEKIIRELEKKGIKINRRRVKVWIAEVGNFVKLK